MLAVSGDEVVAETYPACAGQTCAAASVCRALDAVQGVFRTVFNTVRDNVSGLLRTHAERV